VGALNAHPYCFKLTWRQRTNQYCVPTCRFGSARSYNYHSDSAVRPLLSQPANGATTVQELSASDGDSGSLPASIHVDGIGAVFQYPQHRDDSPVQAHAPNRRAPAVSPFDAAKQAPSVTAEEDTDGWLGTWAGRQRIFARQVELEEEYQRRRDQEGASLQGEYLPVDGSVAYEASEDASTGINSQDDVASSSGGLNDAAWRWRFTRKWQVRTGMTSALL